MARIIAAVSCFVAAFHAVAVRPQESGARLQSEQPERRTGGIGDTLEEYIANIEHRKQLRTDSSTEVDEGSPRSSQADSSVELPAFPGEGQVSAMYPLALQTFFAENNELPKDEVMKVLDASEKLMKEVPALLEVDIGSGHINVIGDLHGQIHELLTIFEKAGQPSKTNPYLFNGDFVDRGSYGMEVVLILLAWKQAFPHHVHLNRGNHEYVETSSRYGFWDEVDIKYGGDKGLYEAFFTKVFRYLPLATVISERVFVCHGGLPTKPEDQALPKMKEMLDLEPEKRLSLNGPLQQALLWNDPRPELGERNSPRGPGIYSFGPDITQKFLETNNLALVIRSHEVRHNGISFDHDLNQTTKGRLIGLMTVFSAANYVDEDGNKGGIIEVEVKEGKVKTEYVRFEAGARPEGYIEAGRYPKTQLFWSKLKRTEEKQQKQQKLEDEKDVLRNKKEAMQKMQESAQSSDSSIWTGIARCLGCATK